MALFLGKTRLTLLILIQYIRRNIGVVALTLSILAGLLFLQAKFNLLHPASTVRIGIIGTYQAHDLPETVTRLLSDNLLDMIKGREINSDSTNFKFKLKDNLFWADNTKVLASDLMFNIPDVEVSTAGEGIVQFKLKDSYSPLPSLLTKPVFKKGTNLGTGPYFISKIEKSKIFITKLTLDSKDKSLPKINVRFYPNEKVADTGFNLGEVQALLGIPNPIFAKENPKVKLASTTDYGKIVTIIYNTKDSLLGNRSLRQALSFQAPAIAGFEIANNPFPKNSWAYDPDSKKYLDNNKEAKAALERAKSAMDLGDEKKELTITAIPNLEIVAKKVAKAWENLGFNVKVRIESGIPQNFQILLITQSIPEDPDQYFLWHSTQEKTNLSKYSSARVDKDLEDARKISDQEERKNKYFDFQHTLLEDAPATFLYFPKNNIVYLKKVEPLLEKVLSHQK